MEEAAVLAAAGAWQAACCPLIPATAPIRMAISSSKATLAARVMDAEPRSAPGRVMAWPSLSAVPGAGGLDVPDGPAGAARGEGDREAGHRPGGAAGAGGDLADGDGDGDRAGGQVPDLPGGDGGGGGLPGGVALGEDAGGAGGAGQGRAQFDGGHGEQPG